MVKHFHEAPIDNVIQLSLLEDGVAEAIPDSARSGLVLERREVHL